MQFCQTEESFRQRLTSPLEPSPFASCTDGAESEPRSFQCLSSESILVHVSAAAHVPGVSVARAPRGGDVADIAPSLGLSYADTHSPQDISNELIPISKMTRRGSFAISGQSDTTSSGYPRRLSIDASAVGYDSDSSSFVEVRPSESEQSTPGSIDLHDTCQRGDEYTVSGAQSNIEPVFTSSYVCLALHGTTDP